ncbi:hypothetical protein [Amycolatopsis cihanbeyliensis]|uniref:hypothetical protein n=1 Tax=Amycolatopsis cihanbeyliensis TaxID=1128664 RepID=UPI001150614F|nr:hypothetical protein [Amycolatopsis cihanbeyliensis]
MAPGTLQITIIIAAASWMAVLTSAHIRLQNRADFDKIKQEISELREEIAQENDAEVTAGLRRRRTSAVHRLDGKRY